MTTMTTTPPRLSAPPTARPDPRTALVTGLLYLGLAITGAVGFLLIRPLLFSEHPDVTAANLVANEGLARVGIALELATVVLQTLAALWFYKLFRAVHAFAAGAIAVFGTINAIAIMGSAAFLATALEVALTPAGQDASQLMYLVSANFWGVGNLFFGLWLIPMGILVLRSGWVHRTLGAILIIGGLFYLANAFAAYLTPGPLLDLLAIPATIGELWVIGWLLMTGLRRPTQAASTRDSSRA